MYLWYTPYGTMQVRSVDLWYHYICKKTWFRQPCKHNGSYRGNISFVVKNGMSLWHNARESAESGGSIKLKNLNGYLSNHKVVCRCDFRLHV